MKKRLIKVNYPPTAINQLIVQTLSRIAHARDLSSAAGVKKELFDLYDQVESEIAALRTLIETNGYSLTYADRLAYDINAFTNAFSSDYGSEESRAKGITLQDAERPTFKRQQEAKEQDIRETFSQYKYSFDFFSKIGFLNGDLVIIGPNGSGKTFLANELKQHIKGNGAVITAQRILHIPTFDHIKSINITAQKLKSVQLDETTTKEQQYENQKSQFAVLLQNLSAADAVAHKNYNNLAKQKALHGYPIQAPRMTNLGLTLDIWNSIFNYRHIANNDGMNIEVQTKSGSYPAVEMSEGEKVGLFLIAQVLQVPDRGIIIVDEPEMYLHPTIHKKLWDKLETARPDSIFVYLTHDLDFAASRTGKKLWLRSFICPDKFTLEEIPTSNIPKPLLLELLGSRRSVLFCEGESGGTDEKVYSRLFPDFTIKPVGGCSMVINFTKAFNKLPNITTQAFGLIDSDYQGHERIAKIQGHGIHGLPVAEIENLLLDEPVLKAVCEHHKLGSEKIAEVKSAVLKKLFKEKSIQVANFVSAKVDHFFKDNNVAKGNTLKELNGNLDTLLQKINVERWGLEQEQKIDGIIATNDYFGALKIFNDKGLEAIANSILKIKNFNDLAIELLQQNHELRVTLLRHFPSEFVNGADQANTELSS